MAGRQRKDSGGVCQYLVLSKTVVCHLEKSSCKQTQKTEVTKDPGV